MSAGAGGASAQARAQMAQLPPAISGTRRPPAAIPVASSSSVPIITSRWRFERLTPAARFPGSTIREPSKPKPNAMWAAAFSSSSVLKYVRPVLPIRGRPVDERHLAEAPRAGIDVEERGQEVAIVVRRSLEPDEPPAAELAGDPADLAAVERERARAAKRALGRARLRAREALLGREVRRQELAVRVLLPATDPARARREAQLELGAGPTKLDPLELELGQRGRSARDRIDVRFPAGVAGRVVRAEPAEPEQVVGEPSLRRFFAQLGIGDAGPVRGRPGDRRPSAPVGSSPRARTRRACAAGASCPRPRGPAAGRRRRPSRPRP